MRCDRFELFFMLRFSRFFSRSVRRFNKPPKDSNGLIYGKFTEKEYDEAAQYIRDHIAKLENDIKGTSNIRENLGKMPSFPMATKTKPRVDNLSNLLEETIKTTGPLSLSAFMRQCLTHPQFGYYTTRDPLDTATGDFITSPEISSVFGEMIGIYMFQIWLTQNRPRTIKFIEFGPGKGTLMHDVLTSFNKLNKFDIDIEVELIETSRVLRREQHSKLCGTNEYVSLDHFDSSTTIWGNKIRWIENESEINNNELVPNYIIAHEFFDALPIKSFQRTEEGWRELLVEHTPLVGGDAKELNLPEDTEFHLTLSTKETPSSLIPTLINRFKDLPVDTRIEICPDAEFFVKKMGSLVNNEKKLGAVLIVDYGVVNEIPDNSLRGIYKHKFVSPFYKPGEVDLSINVDFDNIKLLAQDSVMVLDPVDQGDFLHELGIGHRIQQLLMKNNDEKIQEKIYNAYKRLTDKDDKSMGKIYKFIGFLPKGSEVPLGFQKLV